MVLMVCKGEFPWSSLCSPGSGGFSTAPRALGGGFLLMAVLGAAWLTVQLHCSPFSLTKPSCIFSCRFSDELTRMVSALFLPLPPPPCPGLG